MIGEQCVNPKVNGIVMCINIKKDSIKNAVFETRIQYLKENLSSQTLSYDPNVYMKFQQEHLIFQHHLIQEQSKYIQQLLDQLQDHVNSEQSNQHTNSNSLNENHNNICTCFKVVLKEEFRHRVKWISVEQPPKTLEGLINLVAVRMNKVLDVSNCQVLYKRSGMQWVNLKGLPIEFLTLNTQTIIKIIQLSHKPILTNEGVYTTPSIKDLRLMSKIELRKVNHFTYFCEFGKVVFLKPVNLVSANLDKLITFKQDEFKLYDYEGEIPKKGEGLNVECEVTFKGFENRHSNYMEWAELRGYTFIQIVNKDLTVLVSA